MFGVLRKDVSLKKVKSISRISNDCFYLNILVDLGNYYGLTSGNKKLNHISVYNYLKELEQGLPRFSYKSRETTKESMDMLSIAVRSIRDNSFTFSKLCKTYCLVISKENVSETKLTDFSSQISRKLGEKSVEYNKAYVKERLIFSFASRLLRYEIQFLDSKVKVSSIRNMFGRRITIDNSFNLYVDLDEFTLRQSTENVSIKSIIKYALHECCLNTEDKNIVEFFHKCVETSAKIKSGRGLSLDQIEERARGNRNNKLRRGV